MGSLRMTCSKYLEASLLLVHMQEKVSIDAKTARQVILELKEDMWKFSFTFRSMETLLKESRAIFFFLPPFSII